MFVTFEGVDGAGKTTQVELLASHLREAGREVVVTREPGGTALGERVRDLLLRGEDMSAWAEAALFTAARAELVAEVIAPALERGAWVVCDRYVDSSLAYQGIARGLGVDAVLELNTQPTNALLPDRTYVLLVGEAESARRVGSDGDRIEREGGDFRTRVADAYRELAARFPERIVALDGTLPPEDVARAVREDLAAHV
ncbi:MAG: dTMP kinase [Gaiellaceae bacterium]